MDNQQIEAKLTTFTKAMQQKLEANVHKGGWFQESLEYLMARLVEEWSELLDAINAGDIEAIKSESVDVANFAMMIYDSSWRAKQ